MLNQIKGIPIAKVNDKIIYLSSPNQDVKELFSKKYKEQLKKLKPKQKEILINSLQNKTPPLDKSLIKLYEEGLKDIEQKGFNMIKSKQKVQVLPRKDLCEKIYISGVSGSGKSTYTGKYIKEFKKMFKNDEIFVFSSVSSDSAFDKYDPVRIPIDDDLLNEPFHITDFEDSLTIFDDTDTIREKNYRNVVNDIKAEMIEIGRHYKARCIITSHMISDYRNTRQILNECTSITFFPKSSGQYHIKNYLKTHAGLDKEQINRILKLPSRWITIYRTYPSYIVWENGLSILSEF
jgi:hypothetical protein